MAASLFNVHNIAYVKPLRTTADLRLGPMLQTLPLKPSEILPPLPLL